MKFNSIGLFGDSFGAGIHHYSPQFSLPKSTGDEHHWSIKIEKLLGMKLFNYSFSGTSLYYSLLQFIQHQHKHKINILLITKPGRYTKFSEVYGKNMYLPNLSTLERNGKSIPMYNDLVGFFLSQDMEYEKFVHDLMVEKILQINRNVILIPCFSDSLKNPLVVDSQKIYFNLADFRSKVLRDNNMYELIDTHMENRNIWAGHMLPEMSDIVTKNLQFRISNGYWNWQEPIIKINYQHEDLWIKR